MTQFFTIIIPTLNEEAYLPHLLGDLQRQKEQNFEVVVIDASSQDKTIHIADGFKKKLLIASHCVKKKSVSYQKNFGAAQAKGEYLIFLDADCRVRPTFTKELYKQIIKKKGLVFLPYIDPEGMSPQVRGFFQLVNFVVEVSQSTSKPLSSVGAIVWEKNFFQRVKGFNEKVFVSEDHGIVQKAYQWGVRAQFLPTIKITFSLRRLKREGKLKSMYKIFVGTFYTLVKGDTKEKIFEYEMGGHLYKDFLKKT